MSWNLRRNLEQSVVESATAVEGYRWGEDADKLLCHTSSGGFDILVLSDLLYELEHEELAQACHDCIKPGGRVYVSFQLHDSQASKRNMAFFHVCASEPYNFRYKEVCLSSHFFIQIGICLIHSFHCADPSSVLAGSSC